MDSSGAISCIWTAVGTTTVFDQVNTRSPGLGGTWGAPTTIAEGDQAPNETFPFFANITSNAQGDLAAIVTYATLDSSAMNLTAPFLLNSFIKNKELRGRGRLIIFLEMMIFSIFQTLRTILG